MSRSSSAVSPAIGSLPRLHSRASTAPRKVSPAPLVSATWTEAPGTEKLSPRQRQKAPRSPSVTKIREMPRSSNRRLPSSGSRVPVRRGSSSSDSLITSTRGRGMAIHWAASSGFFHRGAR